MLQARIIGDYIQRRANEQGVSIARLSEVLGCPELQTKRFLKGRAIASFAQLSRLAELLQVSVSDIIDGDMAGYEREVVHCMNSFSNSANREKVLDIIDNYMDIKDALVLTEATK